MCFVLVFKPVKKSKQEGLRAYCSYIYTVSLLIRWEKRQYLFGEEVNPDHIFLALLIGIRFINNTLRIRLKLISSDESKPSLLEGLLVMVLKLLNKQFNKGPFKYYVSKVVGGWGQKMAIFADLQRYFCWRRWVGLKKRKTCWRNTWMVPNTICLLIWILLTFQNLY